MSKPNFSKRKSLAVVAAIAAFGAVSASAASLGGLTGTSLGADTSVVASCDTDGVAVGYTTAYAATPKEYQVSGVTLTGVAAACNGKSANVTVANAAGTSLGSATATVAGTSVSFTLPAGVSAQAVGNVAVVISG
jgi:hypothetical protein